MVIEPAFGTFGSVCRWPSPAGSPWSLSAEGSMKCSKIPGRWLRWLWTSETQRTTPSRWHGSPNHHWLWKLHTGLQAAWILYLSSLPPDSGTLISKLNVKIYSHLKKRTLDHWATVQLFFSLAQMRCFWRCFCFRSGLVALFLKMSERGDFWCTDSSFSSLLLKLSQVFELALLDRLPWQACSHPCCLCTFSYAISSF